MYRDTRVLSRALAALGSLLSDRCSRIAALGSLLSDRYSWALMSVSVSKDQKPSAILFSTDCAQTLKTQTAANIKFTGSSILQNFYMGELCEHIYIENLD